MWNNLSDPAASPLDIRFLLKANRKVGSGSSFAEATSWCEGSRSPGQLELCEATLILTDVNLGCEADR